VSPEATKKDPFFPDSRPFDFRAFQFASDATTCGGKPLPVISVDNSYAVCVDDVVRTIHPEDRVAFNVKVSLSEHGQKNVLQQFSLVSTVGLPVMYETSEQAGYLAAEIHAETPIVAVQSPAPEEAVSLSFDPIGRSNDGKWLVQTRVVLASRGILKTYLTADGSVFRSVDGNLAKGTFTSLFPSGTSQTYHAGDAEIEVTVLSLPRL
jgi:hypothetical protein